MSLNRIRNWLKSAAARLALAYAFLFVVSAALGYTVLYLLVASYLLHETDLDLHNQAREFLYYVENDSLSRLRAEMEREGHARGTKNSFYRLFTEKSSLLCNSDLSQWPRLSTTEQFPASFTDKKSILATLSFDGEDDEARVIYCPITSGKVLSIGVSLKDDNALLEELRTVGLLMGLIMAALGAAVGWLMARKAMSGIKEVTHATTEIAEGRFDRRVVLATYGEEINQLATTFNTMAARIQKMMIEMREINDNIAHDLRSPLTRLRGVAETTLTGPEALEDYKTMAASTIEECDRLLFIINTMLDISEAEAGVAKLQIESVDLAVIVRTGLDLFEPSAEEKGIRIERRHLPEIPILGDEKKLQRMFANLLDNAVKYTPSGGTISTESWSDNGFVRVSITDTGVGIPESDLPRIFERFFRGDQSRSESGNGLGLCLARAIAKAHGGRIVVMSTLGKGSTFSVFLPPSGL